MAAISAEPTLSPIAGPRGSPKSTKQRTRLADFGPSEATASAQAGLLPSTQFFKSLGLSRDQIGAVGQARRDAIHETSDTAPPRDFEEQLKVGACPSTVARAYGCNPYPYPP